MSKQSEALRAIGVFNTWNLLQRFAAPNRDIAVTYDKRPEGRMGMAQCDKSRVFSPSHQTNPKSAWYDYGQKSFTGNRADSFPEAIAWATETYGITEWDTCPMNRNTKIPKEAKKAALAALKDTVKGGA